MFVRRRGAGLAAAEGVENKPGAAGNVATQHVNLCLSPQCGFSSTHHGNKLTQDEQWRKLERVVEVAKEVWT